MWEYFFPLLAYKHQFKWKGLFFKFNCLNWLPRNSEVYEMATPFRTFQTIAVRDTPKSNCLEVIKSPESREKIHLFSTLIRTVYRHYTARKHYTNKKIQYFTFSFILDFKSSNLAKYYVRDYQNNGSTKKNIWS